MIWALKESQQDDKKYIPYGRLISEIFYQGVLLNVLKNNGVVSNEHLGTMTRKVINGRTLRYMSLVKSFIKLDIDLKESQVVSDLIIDFPPISKQDNLEVLPSYVLLHHERTSEIINYSSIPETQVGAPIRISRKRKAKKKKTEVEDESEVKPKKQKKAKTATKLIVSEPTLQAIQEEIANFGPVEVLNTRTRGGSSVDVSTEAATSEVVVPQSNLSIQKKRKRQPMKIRQMVQSKYTEEEDVEIEKATALVKKFVKNMEAA